MFFAAHKRRNELLSVSRMKRRNIMYKIMSTNVLGKYEKQILSLPEQLPKRFSAEVIFMLLGHTFIIGAYFSTKKVQIAFAHFLASKIWKGEDC